MSELADPGSFRPISDGLESRDPLDYPGYRASLEAAQERSGVDEAVVSGPASIGGHEVELATFSFAFMGGSMGEVAGERIARALERGAERAVPFVLSTATGGARMQEGMRSLVQMPRVVAARLTLADAHQPFIAVLGNPTTGGVFASIGSLADVTVAVAGATIGFAGPRVVTNFTGMPLERDSHTANSALNNGLVDAVVPESDVNAFVAGVLSTLAEDDPVAVDEPPPPADPDGRSAWEIVQGVRSNKDPAPHEPVRSAARSFVELSGDRAGGRDAAVLAGIARFHGRKAVVISLNPAHAPTPAGFRLSLRALKIAGRLRLPVVTMVDTKGADPSKPSEASGIAASIAGLLEAMLEAPVPVLSFVTGEGGSGGALAFATGNRLIAYDDSIFSVIAPEAAAEILWRDSARTEEAAELLKLTAHDLLRLGIADSLVRRPPDGAGLEALVAYHLDRLQDDPHQQGWAAARRQRWRR